MKAIHTYFTILMLSTFLSGCIGDFGNANVGDFNEPTVSDTNETAVGDSDESESPNSEVGMIEIAGAGIKGPLAFADVKIYQLNPGFSGSYDSDTPISTAITNSSAQITGLSVPVTTPPPYVLVIGGDLAIDLNTGEAPVIQTLITIITEEMLTAKQPIYTTPLTTLAFYMASFGASNSADATEFARMMEENAAPLIINQFSLNQEVPIDLFRSPLIINAATATTATQEEAVYHRAALEAFAVKIHQQSVSLDNVSTESILKSLARDLMNDGVVNNRVDGAEVGNIDPSVLLQNPMNLLIPHTEYRVEEIASLMEAERILIGTDRYPVFHTDTIFLVYSGATSNNSTSSDQHGPKNQTFDISGPIIISGEQDIVINGLKITNPNGTCIDISGGASNIIIENSEIGPCGNRGVNIFASNNVTIRNSYIHDTYHEAIMTYESHHIDVTQNRIERVESGVEFWTTDEGHLTFTSNYVKNISRRAGSGNGGDVATAIYVSGPGIRINNNIGINVFGESYPTDLINVYSSNGRADDPIQIKNNRLIGGGPMDSGGGILLGDQGGSYQIAENNILVNPGQYGMSIAGGNNIVVRNNQIFSDDQRDFTNVGLFVLRFNKNGDGTQPGECFGHTVEYNEVTWWKGPNYKNNGLPASYASSYNPEYIGDNYSPNCGTVTGWDTNKFDTESQQPANLDMTIWNSAWNNP